MKVTACLLLLASTAMAAPNKEAKAFSLFSVVTFPNDECTTVMDPTMRGLCITAEECTDQGGTASGNCASGFGVCCFTTVTATGEISNNVTYIQNEGFPTAVLAGTPVPNAITRQFTVRGGENICQVRFDFDTAVFAPPTTGTTGTVSTAADATTGGVCNVDTITVTQTSAGTIGGFENLCGTLTGQHIYVENDGANPATTLNIDTGAVSLARTWKVLVRTIECDSPAKAPGGCLQYLTGMSGNFQSFNYGSTTSGMIDNLLYNVCIRKEPGMCSFDVRQARSGAAATPDAFYVGATSTTAAGTGIGTVAAAAGCTAADGFAWLTIPNIFTADSTFCGGVLANTAGQTEASPVTGIGAQFQIRVTTTVGNQGIGGTGFDLVYAQKGCSSFTRF